MKFLPTALLALPVVATGWSLFPSYGGLMRTATRPLVVYSPEAMFQQQRALMQNAFTQTSPRYEITNTDENFKIALDIPGLDAKDINVSVEDEGRILSITGSKEETDENYSYKSKFSQSFSLDPTIDLEKVVASVKNGVLTIDAPKDPVKVAEMIRKIDVVNHDKEEDKIEVKEEPEEVPIKVEHKKVEAKKQESEKATA